MLQLADSRFVERVLPVLFKKLPIYCIPPGILSVWLVLVMSVASFIYQGYYIWEYHSRNDDDTQNNRNIHAERKFIFFTAVFQLFMPIGMFSLYSVYCAVKNVRYYSIICLCVTVNSLFQGENDSDLATHVKIVKLQIMGMSSGFLCRIYAEMSPGEPTLTILIAICTVILTAGIYYVLDILQQNFKMWEPPSFGRVDPFDGF